MSGITAESLFLGWVYLDRSAAFLAENHAVPLLARGLAFDLVPDFLRPGCIVGSALGTYYLHWRHTGFCLETQRKAEFIILLPHQLSLSR